MPEVRTQLYKTREILSSLFLSLKVIQGLLENLLGGRSLVFVNTEERQNQLVNLLILEFSLQWTLHILPAIDVLLRVEEMLPVVGDVGDDDSKTPHVRRGCDVAVISQNQHKATSIRTLLCDFDSLKQRLMKVVTSGAW